MGIKVKLNLVDGVTDLLVLFKQLGKLGFVCVIVNCELFNFGVSFGKATMFVMEVG